MIHSPEEYKGTYNLVRQLEGEKDPNCVDKCIYQKEGCGEEQEYCFKSSNEQIETNQQCDAPLSGDIY